MQIDTIFFILILIMSVVIHEISHGHVANILGDPTARLAGRLTLNPRRHIDFIGSILVPFFLIITHSPFLFGWAKPVPYNPYNLRNQKWGTVMVASAGVIANFFIAIIFGLMIKFSGLSSAEILENPLMKMAVVIVGLNLLLGIFNLLPVPPLDGSRILFSLLPYRFQYIQHFLERYWIALILFIFFIAGAIIIPLLSFFFSLITSHSLLLYIQAMPL